MMLAAWNDGVVSCPNGVRDPDAAAEICGGEVKAILSFGYPARPRDVAGRTAERLVGAREPQAARRARPPRLAATRAPAAARTPAASP